MNMKNEEERNAKGESPSRLIDARIKELDDWRGKTLSHVRALIKQADPEVVEEWKWRGVPVWSHDGLICTGETYKSVVKLTFAKGASLEDPSGLFNSSLEGNVRRAIDIHEGDEIDDGCLQDADTRRCGSEQVIGPIVESNSSRGGAGRLCTRAGTGRNRQLLFLNTGHPFLLP